MDEIGRRVNFAYISRIEVGYVITEFWKIINSTKTTEIQRREIQELLSGLDRASLEDPNKFYQSKNPSNEKQSILACLKKLGINLYGENTVKENTVKEVHPEMKKSVSTGLMFYCEEEEPTQDVNSPRSPRVL